MRNCFMTRLPFLSALLATLMVLPLAAEAQVYRWTDERGRVTYGSKAPPGARNVTRLNEDGGNVSTVPGVPPEQLEAMRERSQQQRADRLERELDAERRASRAGAGENFDQRAWLERCRAERRVDCDDPTRGAYFDPGFAYFPPVVRPPRPLPIRPVPPQQQLPWPSPGGPVVVSPPTGPGPRLTPPPNTVLER